MRGSYFVWLVLAGCPAEQLGIPVPQHGIRAVQMEDLVRDVTKLSRGEGASSEAARMQFLDDRWRQMGLESKEGGRCGWRAGTGPEAVAVVAEPGTPGDPLEQAPTAVVISVAKAFHGRPADQRGVWFCVGEPPGQVVWASKIGAEDVKGAGGAGDLDYRVLEQVAKERVPVVEAQVTQ